jgi:hypothetical protein
MNTGNYLNFTKEEQEAIREQVDVRKSGRLPQAYTPRLFNSECAKPPLHNTGPLVYQPKIKTDILPNDGKKPSVYNL